MPGTPVLTDVIGYLRSRGWTRTGSWRAASVWTWRDFDVLVPRENAGADIRMRLIELARCVAEAETRSPEAVWRDLIAPAVDTLTFHTHADATASLAAGAHTVLAVRELMTVCARQVRTDPAGAVAETDPAAIDNLLRRSLLEVDESSRALRVSVPVEHGDPESLARRTTARVLHSSNAIRAAIDLPIPEAREILEHHRVSDIEHRALAKLSGPEHTLPFEIGFHWSWVLPLPDQTVRYPESAGVRIAALSAESARPTEVSGRGGIRGSVVGLSNDPNGARWQLRVRGTLEVEDSVIDGPRTATVSLGNQRDYEAALGAHRDGLPVRATGAVTRNGRKTEIHTGTGTFVVGDHDKS
ncbi:hypothetical protein [Nocardia sp. NBC_00511]|uniref:hypothetical protein n=1 Tax=Nocardia sp. NBC_00511 TaxID=2903591 RepID=UPI0030E1C7D5